MKHEIILSVIIPVYNTVKELKTCLDSICMQQIPNMEIIVIDDASSQNIASVISQYKNNKIIYKRLEKHSGPGGARNYGLQIATGRYIGFCDSDDWVDYDYYSKSVTYMENTGADIGMCTLVREYDYSTKTKVFKSKYDELLTLDSDTVFRIMTYQYQNGLKVIPPCTNKIYRKDFLDVLKVYFEKDMYFQDVYFSFQTILNAQKIICIPKVQYHHYKRHSSIIQSFSSKHTDDFVKLFTLLRSYLKDLNLYQTYCMNYYKLLEHFYNIIVREIFEFSISEQARKDALTYLFKKSMPLINFEEYMEYTSSEEIRRHIQPDISDTTLY